jgi:hypothetical protein
VTELVERVSMDALSEVAHGPAYVQSVAVENDHTNLALSYPFGRLLEVVISDLPDDGDATDLQRPLAVKVSHSTVGTECSVLDRRGGGPTRVPITLARALALAGAGIHTVFDVR